MKNLKSLLLLIPIVLIIQEVPAQSKIKVEVNGGIVGNNVLGQNGLSYWPDGWTSGIGLKYALIPEIEIGVNASYSNLRFDKNRVAITAPTVCCYRYEATGSNAQVYETAVSIQLNSMPDFFIRPYFTFRTGIYFINKGEILINSYEFNSIAKTNGNAGAFGDSGRNYTKIFAGAGVGLAVRFSHSFELRTQVMLTSALGGGQTFLPITTGINYGFK